MKKITLLGAALFACVVGFAQTENTVVETGGENNPIVYVESNYQLAPCVLVGPGNAFENGKSCTWNLGRFVAHDITVLDGEDELLESFVASVFIGPTGGGITAAFVDVFVYGDTGGGLPDVGNIIAMELAVIPVSQVVTGTNFGFDVYDVTLDIIDVLLPGTTGSDTTYWVGISLEATDASNVFWENSTAGLIGFEEAYDDGTGYATQAGLEGVYTFTGDCTPIFAVEDNLADLVHIYPNPVTTRINIDVPANIEILDVALYDILGKNTGAILVNGAIDVTNLSRGVYILNVKSDQGTLTQKVIKR